MTNAKSTLNSVLNEINYMSGLSSGDVVEFNSDTALEISNRIRRISNNIYNTCSAVKGITSNASNFWTGEAAEIFIAECEELLKKTDKLYQKLETDRKNIDLAAQRLTAGDDSAKQKIERLSTNDIF